MKIYTSPQPNPQSNPAPPPPASKLTPTGYFAREAFFASICAAAFLGSIAIILARFLPDISPIDLSLGVISLSALIGGLVGFFWTTRNINRPVKLLKKEIKALQSEIDYLTDLKTPAAPAPPKEPDESPALLSIIAAYELCTRKFADLPTARKESDINQTIHNNAVKILRELSIVTGERKATTYNTDPKFVFSQLSKLSTERKDPQIIYIADAPGQIRPIHLKK